MQEPMNRAHPSFKPGDRVIIREEEAQRAVGGTCGIVVGDTNGQPHEHGGKVIVAVDGPRTDNAVVAPADLQYES